MDRVSREVRSRIMSAIRAKHTTPERIVRKLLTALGVRYRLHYKKVPGRPDVAMPGRRKAVFVNGCFWHFHGCHLSRMPKSSTAFWTAKFSRNKERDKRKIEELQKLGWDTLVVWECECETGDRLTRRLSRFLKM